MAIECVWPWPQQYQPSSVFQAPGCICPPTSEQTCENPDCPRQNPLKRERKADQIP